ncbi:SLAC1 anion channel family protein [Nocardioides sp.]|uniref:SLAC1 anion channel family protein n=1 Tax=Nocardioides sp. TaxID=35761 RepID=UPI003D1507BB
MSTDDQDLQVRREGAPTLHVEAEASDARARLAHFPVTFFATVMGLAGLSIAWARAAAVIDVPSRVGEALFWASLCLYAAVLLAYGAKVVLHPHAVREELAHPVRIAFVPTITIALLLVATAGQHLATSLAEVLWWGGAAGQLMLTLYVLSSWINRPTFSLEHVTPAWFIPVVGLVVVPLAGVQFASREVSWFFFAVGVTFWIPLLAMVLSRLFVHDRPVPARLLPTLAVLIAPPAVAAVAYLRLVPEGGEGPVPRLLYYVALFFALLFLAQVNRLRKLPFFLSWWAYAFPFAALSVATSVMAGEIGGWFFTAASWTFLVAVTALIALLAVRTTVSMLRGEICVPE